MVAATRSTRSVTSKSIKKENVSTVIGSPLKPTKATLKKKVVLTNAVEELKTPPSSPSKKKTASPKKVNVELEDALGHIVVPKDLSLPKEFAEFHSPEFINGVNHIIKTDPTLYPVIVYKNFPLYAVAGSTDSKVPQTEADILQLYWYALISGIISQQVSGAAALSIENKFNMLFGPEGTKNATPELVLQKTHEELRGAGLSNKKVEYVQNISEHFINPKDNKLARLEFYKNSSDEEISEELILLKGIGPWSIKMFLTFTLNRFNVFAFDDLGVARGSYRYLNRRKSLLEKIKKEVKKDEALTKLLSKRSKFAASKGKRDWTPYHDVYIAKLGEEFKPYQLIMMMLLWRLSSTNVDVLAGTTGKNPN